ncbi:hypothetical protein T492DRAFT_884144 [Pavlovales sp. CCMP2436]|nr:hypothetical protein T492DRAFT_884144 [Pavlovales sp. CCMP2436]
MTLSGEKQSPEQITEWKVDGTYHKLGQAPNMLVAFEFQSAEAITVNWPGFMHLARGLIQEENGALGDLDEFTKRGNNALHRTLNCVPPLGAQLWRYSHKVDTSSRLNLVHSELGTNACGTFHNHGTDFVKGNNTARPLAVAMTVEGILRYDRRIDDRNQACGFGLFSAGKQLAARLPFAAPEKFTGRRCAVIENVTTGLAPGSGPNNSITIDVDGVRADVPPAGYDPCPPFLLPPPRFYYKQKLEAKQQQLAFSVIPTPAFAAAAVIRGRGALTARSPTSLAHSLDAADGRQPDAR